MASAVPSCTSAYTLSIKKKYTSAYTADHTMSQPICFEQEPELKEISPGHCVKCHFAQESRERMLRAETSSIES